MDEKYVIKTANLYVEDVRRVEIARAKDNRSFSNMLQEIIKLGLDEWWRRRGEIEPRPDAPRDDSEPKLEVE